MCAPTTSSVHSASIRAAANVAGEIRHELVKRRARLGAWRTQSKTIRRSRKRVGQQSVDAKYRTPLAQVRQVQLIAIELDEPPDVSLLYC